MKLYIITVIYGPAVMLARSLACYRKSCHLKNVHHVVVDGHYPINEKKNCNDVKLVCDAFNIEYMDLGRNLGSAQSQNWCLQRLDIKESDYFINLDPDSDCQEYGWDLAMSKVFDNDPNCVLISCMAPMVKRYLGDTPLEKKGNVIPKENTPAFGFFPKEADAPIIPRYVISPKPTPFNLSMWRYSFIKEIGGIPQMGLWWGETEGPFYQACKRRDKYHAYLLDYLENEDGKFLQDKQNNEYKDLHMRTAPPNQFLGSFEEFLRWKYPKLLEIDTCKNLQDHNHP